MHKDGSQQAYCQSVGTSSTNYAVIDTRDPTPNDIYYPIGKFWINQSAKNLWYLNSQTNASGILQSLWELISVSSILVSLSDTSNTRVFPTSSVSTPPDNIQLVAGSGISIVATPISNLLTITNTGSASTETLTGDDAVAVSPSGGTIQTLGNVVANATFSKALYTNNPSGNIERFNIQLSAAIASTNVANVGLSAFSSAQFAVDSNGFVTLKGGSTSAILGITPDAHTGPGTSPVIPNSSTGNIILEGGVTFATGTQANPIRTNSLAANTIDLQIQLAGSNAASSTPNDFGVAQFDSNAFTVTSGFVALKNSGTTGAVTGVLGDDGGANIVVPNGSGTIILDGIVVNNATNAKPVFFKKNAASTEELDIQVTTTAGSSSKNNSGLASFSNAQFSSDSNGFITLAGGSTAPLLTITTDDTNVIGPNGSGTILFDNATSNTIRTIGNVAGHVIKAIVSFTNNAFLLGQGLGTEATTIGPLTNGQIIIGSTGVAPVAATLTAGTGITITNGAGSISIASSNGLPVVGFTPDTTVGGGVSPIVPSGSGLVKVTSGPIFNTGTLANALRTDTTAANTLNIELQYAGNASGSTPIANNYGVSQFNSTEFTVSAGVVSSNNFTINTSGGLTGGGSITLGGTLNLSASTSVFPWVDQSVSFSALVNTGYFVTATATATLPASPAQGNTISFAVDSVSGILTIQANTGQIIQIARAISASTGIAVSNFNGDSVTLVFRASDSKWIATSEIGTWTVT